MDRNHPSLGDDAPERDYAPLLVLQTGRPGQVPLVCVPGAGANAASFAPLTTVSGESLPIWGLQPRGLDGELNPYASVEEAAQSYLHAIDAVRPGAPVHLLGHSFGGWVVFEMARLLRDAGRPAASLTILDSEAPGQSQRPDIDDAEAMMKLIDIFELMAGRSLEIARDDLQLLDDDGRLRLLHQRLVQYGVMPRRSEPDILRGPLRVFTQSVRTHYEPGFVDPGPVRLVLLDDQKAGAAANRIAHARTIAGWRKFAPALEVWMGPGNHMTVFQQPHVAVFAEWLRSKL